MSRSTHMEHGESTRVAVHTLDSYIGYVVLTFTTIKVQGLHRYSEPVASDDLLATYLTLLGLKEVVGELLGYFVLAFIVSGTPDTSWGERRH